jgi:3-oxoacyl-[acyl-carrier protein] reductase
METMNPLEGKVAIVTGASRGIGRATAERLARDGASVVVNYAKSAGEALEVVEAITARGGTARAVAADVGRSNDVTRLFHETVEAFAGLDILVANAGHALFKPFVEITEEEFTRTHAVNLMGTFFCLQEALRHMRRGGRIVCVSTIGTELNLPGGSAYFATKAAVEQLCRTLAKEVAPRGITVNVVSPGFVETRMLQDAFADLSPSAREEVVAMTPLGRLGRPEDIAGAIAFLVGSGAEWITRQNIAVDGGIISR